MNRYSLGTPWSTDLEVPSERPTRTPELVGAILAADDTFCRAIYCERVRVVRAADAEHDRLERLARFLPQPKAWTPSLDTAPVAPSGQLVVEHLVTGLRTSGAPSHSPYAFSGVGLAAA